MLDKALFETMRNDHRQAAHAITIPDVCYQITHPVTLQVMVMAADKNVSLLGNNLGAQIPLIIETPGTHQWQLDPVLQRPNVMLMVLKFEDARPSIASCSDPRKLVEISKTQAFLWFK